ncbi:hypothetical protein [Mycolicibacterium sphagni]|nr:hypothetical protein [Mycolicibacterium sphagni]MCV7174897.1 hypothetical protein [Mycolicibacterium sphagni]
MKKIISLFERNYDTDRLVRDEITPGAEWVADPPKFERISAYSALNTCTS